MQKRAFDLLKIWCDTLLTYRIPMTDPNFEGALLCPACHSIHGRIADLAFPMALLYVRTGEEKYIKAADGFIDWTERCLSHPDGGWRNDAGSMWKGISAFSALSIGEALYHFKADIPEDIYEKWYKIFIRISDFLNDFFPKIKPAINYFAGTACEQAMAWLLTGNEKYLALSDKCEEVCRSCFDEKGLLYGEAYSGGDLARKTPNGCVCVDIGYNIEESLPLLVRCAALKGKSTEFFRERFRDHLKFMLCDGSIDNSWGSRHNKWTWWGSRTSDGALEGIALLADEPMFAEACRRVLTLYENCTHNGLLALPMAHIAGEPTCIHHSFCHAKALATLIMEENISSDSAPLPSETAKGVELFLGGNVAVISQEGWRATVSTSDVIYTTGCENGGGNMTLLMRGETPICAATLRTFTMIEPYNMQQPRTSDKTPCMTPRLIYSGGDNLTEQGVRLEKLSENEVCTSGDGWNINYHFAKDVTITVTSRKAATFILPIIKIGDVSISDGVIRVGAVEVCSENIKCNTAEQHFNQVGGFIYQPISIAVDEKAVIKIRNI